MIDDEANFGNILDASEEVQATASSVPSNGPNPEK
jgi:hypothetical protein